MDKKGSDKIKMNRIYLSLLTIILLACTSKQAPHEVEEQQEKDQYTLVPEFQSLIDSSEVSGSILIYNLEEDIFYSNDFQWAKKGHLPASTYKITNSIIALETQVVKNDSTLFQWDEQERRLKIWEQDLTFKEAFHYSCVPCYQEVARNIGAKKMNEYLDQLEYGHMDVDSSNIDLFWLEGESHISQFEQIDYLKRLYLSKLPISRRTESIIKRMIVIEENDQYKLSGKTGWSIRNGHNNGWFVGFLESSNKTYFFATNVEPRQEFNMNLFSMIRKDLTIKAFEQMNIVK